MKLTVFQSDKGDCVLVSTNGSDGPFNMLVDGGMSDSYTQHVSPTLNEMQKNEEKLNLVYVSHIDQDHISGILQLFEDMMRWRVFDFQKGANGVKAKEPESLRPPDVEAIWHNAFHEQIGENSGAIEDMLAASAAILSGAESPGTLQMAAEHQDLVTSKAEAIQLSRRVGPNQLKIPLNEQFNHELMCIKEGMPSLIELGGLKIRIIGPFTEDLDKLRDEWNEWLAKSQKQIKSIQSKAREDEKSLLGTEAGQLRDLAETQADELREMLSAPTTGIESSGKRLGRRKLVTTPNLASLMLFVEEGDKTLLLTGDGHAQDILRGLEHHGVLDQNDGQNLHVNVLKVQHHGSEHNIDEEFCRRITADNYIFCGNGEHENPDLDVVKAILNSRLGDDADTLSPNTQVKDKFTFWFNSSESETAKEGAKAHMRELRELVESRVEAGRFEANFLEGESFFTLEV
ncbi:MAG TPA: hypothetical protein VM911_14560 [Pyrinomonadaceae bacterium]|jgi:beta-lactamase superfamily II metal-dependent hydrolase|nr:hypothetical protein [Pyrinomonadaceae bacterium]